MGLETKTVNGKAYFYYRYYYRLDGEKRYTERYIGSRRPTKAELREMKGSYPEVVGTLRATPRPRPVQSAEEEELPVYLL